MQNRTDGSATRLTLRGSDTIVAQLFSPLTRSLAHAHDRALAEGATGGQPPIGCLFPRASAARLQPRDRRGVSFLPAAAAAGGLVRIPRLGADGGAHVREW